MGKLRVENRLPPQVTEAAWEFSVHHNDIIMLYREADLITRIVQELSSDTKIPFRRLLGAIAGKKNSTDEVQTEGMSNLDDGVDPASFIIGLTFRTSASRHEVALCQSVENYLTYVSDLLAAIFRSHPRSLRSGEQVTLEDVLAHDTLEDFAAWVADRKVYTLSMKGLDEVAQFMARRLGLTLIVDESEFSEMRKLVALRNVITHRRGRWTDGTSRWFLTRV